MCLLAPRCHYDSNYAQVSASSIVRWSHSSVVFRVGPGEGARFVSISAFGQDPSLTRTVPDFIYNGPSLALGPPAVQALDGQFSTDGGNRAALSGTAFPLPDIRSLLPQVSSGASSNRVPALTFPIALPLNASGILPIGTLRINFGSRCITGAADISGQIPRSVTSCSAASPVLLHARSNWYSGVSFLQSNADNPSAAALLLNVSSNASAMPVAIAKLMEFPFLTVTNPGEDVLVLVTPPGVGVNISVSLSILDGVNRELWRSNAVSYGVPLTQAGRCRRATVYAALCRSTSRMTPPRS